MFSQERNNHVRYHYCLSFLIWNGYGKTIPANEITYKKVFYELSLCLGCVLSSDKHYLILYGIL